ADPRSSFESYPATVHEIATKAKAGDHAGALALLRGKGADEARINAEKNQAIAANSDKRATDFMANAHSRASSVEWLGGVLLAISLAGGVLVGFMTGRSITK